MIIDADTHISPAPERGAAMDIDGLLREMDRAGVDKALTWLIPPYLRDTDAGNAYIHQAVRAHPDRILGFGWADPNLGVEKAKDTVKRCIYEYGFHGVKLNGAQNSFFIDDPGLALPVIEEIARTGKLVAFHVGGDASDQTNPFRVGRIAGLFPELPILMVHMGGVTNPDLTRAAIEVAREHPRITLVGSSVRGTRILQAIKVLGAARLCFGSDAPFEVMRGEVARYRAILSGEISESDRESIMGGNIARLLYGTQ